MRIALIALFIFLIASSASAARIIYPEDLPKFENFNEEDFKVVQKVVGAGHQSWRFDPVYYAKFFLNFYYLNLGPNEREGLPSELILNSGAAVVKVIYAERYHTIYLHKAFPICRDSIWIIDMMVIE